MCLFPSNRMRFPFIQLSKDTGRGQLNVRGITRGSPEWALVLQRRAVRFSVNLTVTLLAHRISNLEDIYTWLSSYIILSNVVIVWQTCSLSRATNMDPPSAATALKEANGGKLPDITRKIKACVACRKLKVAITINQF